jgi:hypothetical protein
MAAELTMTNETIRGPYTFTTFAAVSATEFYVAASPDGNDFGYPFARVAHFTSDRLEFVDFDFWVSDMALSDKTNPTASGISILAESGQYVLDVRRPQVIEQIANVIASAETGPMLGYLHAIANIGNCTFSCGDGGQTYIRSTAGNWRVLDQSLLDQKMPPGETDVLEILRNPSLIDNPDYMNKHLKELDERNSLDLQDIAGISKDDIYVCGGRGNIERELLHWDGQAFRSLLPPRTNPQIYTSSLSRLLIESDDRIWVCGQRGALLSGNAKEGFSEDPVASGFDTVFYDMAMYGGKLHIAALEEIFRHDGTQLTPLRIDVERKDRGAHTLQAIDGVLWAVSPKDILRFDGNKWERIPYPGND